VSALHSVVVSDLNSNRRTSRRINRTSSESSRESAIRQLACKHVHTALFAEPEAPIPSGLDVSGRPNQPGLYPVADEDSNEPEPEETAGVPSA
jgi:hypothetical protein